MLPKIQEKHFLIIVNYNSGQSIITCINSILQSSVIRPTIVIVDNASRDHSLEMCKKKFPNLVYIYNTHNIGFGAAANIGAHYALERGAKTITFCNPDTILDPSCIHELISDIQNNKSHIVSPVVYADPHHRTIWFAGGKIDPVRMRTTHTKTLQSPSQPFATEYICGCVMMVEASVFTKIGFFDESFFLYYEDADFSVRARKAGFILSVVPAAKVYHKELSELHKETKTYFLVLSGLLFFQKHAHGLTTLWFYMHFFLRRIKNKIAQKKNMPLASTVYKAYCDYAKIRT